MNQTNTYVQNLLAYNCMPTLLKMKPSTILNMQKRVIGPTELFFSVLEREIKPFHCSYEVILETKTSFIVLIYEESRLSSQLEDKACVKILEDFGYQLGEQKIEEAISYLKERYRIYMEDRREFPDELGIFFGYPVEDVKAYIKNQGKNYKKCGFWKVYCNVESAEQAFNRFREVRDAAVEALSEGMPLMEVKRNYQIA